MSSPAKYKRLFGLAAAVFLVDQATKLIVEAVLPFGAFYPPDSIEVIPGFFSIVHVGNTGAAWSLFTGYSYLLGLFGFLALAAIFFFRRSLMLEEARNQWIFGAIVGGILGNVTDRLRLGYVIDFLDFHYDGYYWPSFNVADSAITVGVILYIATSLVAPQPAPKGKGPEDR